MSEARQIEQLDAQRRKVDVEHFDLTVREIIRMANESELSMAPDYQRKFRWEEDSESRLIESILLGLPIPSLFFASNKDGTWEVIDGLQRISTLIHFIGEKEDLERISKRSSLILYGLEKLDTFNGLSFQEFPQQIQLLLMKRGLRVTVLSDKSDYHARFDMFERLNTGGVALTSQEVRACVFRGDLINFLKDMAALPEFKRLIKLQRGKQDDGTREEVVLKFFAYLNKRDEFDGRVTEFLNNYAAYWSKNFSRSMPENLFREVVGRLSSLVDGPYLREGSTITPLVQLEATLVAAGELVVANKRIDPKNTNWLNDEELISFSSGGTNTKSMLNGRINRAKRLLSGKG